MNRRDLLLALPAALVLPELVVPRRTWFLPPRGGWDLGARAIDALQDFIVFAFDGARWNMVDGHPAILRRRSTGVFTLPRMGYTGQTLTVRAGLPESFFGGSR